ncbi:helix-hairpin-helix domain-containing protein [Cytophagales bacterium LB-30]|uniref:Helix-hairpin-helix domain-containing protein n=1 Tax=Shiella aurantiaca TaxID=3058365 RepID=A0ABT8F3B1_9BACT|nr:helix-hairpin-helix domain-containing protein [Shiella aurantiaca]MDN4164724.1 helix-hairpin-helix domain-containing protein [Shiella aurantiaca]
MRTKLNRWIRDYFGFSQREARGFIVLLLLIVVVLCLPMVFNVWWAQPPVIPEGNREKLDSLAAQLLDTLAEEKSLVTQSYILPSDLSPFNPNELNEESWVDLGLPDYIAKRIAKYQAKGGVFYDKEDVQKIYGFPEELYHQLVPYMVFPERHRKSYASNQETNFPEKREKQAWQIIPFNINTADTTQLKQIRGIGSKTSLRILAYRDKLGGFVDTQQFQEVWGLDTAVVRQLNEYAFVSHDFVPQKLAINTAPADSLALHPYVSWQQARLIAAYREQHGAFARPEDLLKIKTLQKEWLDKVRKYIELN